MTEEFKSPMLAAKPKNEADYAKIKYPMWASPKYDGVRAVVRNGKLYSRNGKLIPNKHCQKLFARKAYEGFDGELVVGRPTDKQCFQATMSGVMSEDGVPDVRYYVFDYLRGNVAGYAYHAREAELNKALIGGNHCADQYVVIVPQVILETSDEMAVHEAKLLANGFEGMMLRDPAGLHKHGRSTMREQGLVAIKRFVQAEGVICDVVELLTNTNEQTRDELGRSKRSSAKAGKVPMGKLGAVGVEVVACSEAPELVGSTVHIGTGFNDDQRVVLWKQRAGLYGQRITFKFQVHGSKDAPRIPVFIGFRPEGA